MGEPEPGNNLYVTSLPSTIDEPMVKQVFSAYGTVTQCKVLPVPSPGAKGAALVRFQTVDEATWVVENMNGVVPKALAEPVNVRYANKPSGKGVADTGAWGKGGAATGAQRSSPYSAGNGVQPDNLYVTGLPPNIDDDLLKQFFSAYGTVVQCKVLPSRSRSPAISVALVRFSTPAEAATVKDNLDGTVPPGLSEPVRVTFATAKDGTAGAGMQGGMTSGMMGGAICDKGMGKGKFSIKQLISGFEASGALPGYGSFATEEKAVYVAGLPPDCEDLHLYQLFAPFGPIAPKGIRAMKNPDGSCKGFGFVNYLLAESAQASIQIFNGCEMPDGTIMKVALKREKPAVASQPMVVKPSATKAYGDLDQQHALEQRYLKQLDGFYGEDAVAF